MNALLNKMIRLYLRVRVKDANKLGTIGTDGKVTW